MNHPLFLGFISKLPIYSQLGLSRLCTLRSSLRLHFVLPCCLGDCLFQFWRRNLFLETSPSFDVLSRSLCWQQVKYLFQLFAFNFSEPVWGFSRQIAESKPASITTLLHGKLSLRFSCLSIWSCCPQTVIGSGLRAASTWLMKD